MRERVRERIGVVAHIVIICALLFCSAVSLAQQRASGNDESATIGPSARVTGSGSLRAVSSSGAAYVPASHGGPANTPRRGASLRSDAHGRLDEERHAVFDLCHLRALAQAGQSDGSGRERLVIFGVSGEEISDSDESLLGDDGKPLRGVAYQVMRAVNAHEHARQTFLTVFPMSRFYNVPATTPSPESLRGRHYISAEDMVRAADNDVFAAYSLACTDWVAMPRVVGKEAIWRKVTRQKLIRRQTIEYPAWNLELVLRLEMDVYHRDSAQGFTLVDTVEGSNGGLLGVAFGLAASAKQGGGSAHSALSQRPDPKCPIPSFSELGDVVQHMAQCMQASLSIHASIGTALEHADWRPEDKDLPIRTEENADGSAVSIDLEKTYAWGRTLERASSGRDPSATARLAAWSGEQVSAGAAVAIQAAKQVVSVCSDASDQVSRNVRRLQALARPGVELGLGFAACAGIPLEVDLGEAMAPGASQLNSTYCDIDDAVARGEASLIDVAVCQSRVAMERATLSLQKSAKRIDGWRLGGVVREVVGAKERHCRLDLERVGGERGTVYEVVRRGAHGRETFAHGRVVHGSGKSFEFKWRSDAAPDGTRVEEHPQIGVLLSVRPGLSIFTSTGTMQSSLGYGAMLEGGYDASRFVDFADEVWSRIRVAYLRGAGSESFLAIELTPDAVFYVTGALAVYVTSGLSYARAMSGDGSVSISGGNFGFVAGGGFDLAINADWSSRLGATYRQGLGRVLLSGSSGLAYADAGMLSGLMVSAALGYTF